MNKNPSGLQFPETSKGNRSTIEFCLRLIHHVSPHYSSLPLSEFVRSHKNSFRQNYSHFFLKITEESLQNPVTALSIAEKGLDFTQKEIKFARSGGKCVSISEKMTETNTPFISKIEESRHPFESNPHVIKYKGKELAGKNTCRQLDQWVIKGVMEQDTAWALRSVALPNRPYPNSLDMKDFKDHVFVLIGAGSAMCPFNTLAEMGATIIALDIPVESIWNRLKAKIRNCNGAKMLYPAEVKNGSEVPGCDLLNQTAEIAEWLQNLVVIKNAENVTIGNYTYLDGAKHVLLTVAADSIMSKLSEKFGEKINVAFLCTPTDISVIPKEAYYASLEKYDSLHPGSVFEFLMNKITFGKQLQKNDIKLVGNNYLYNGLVVAQGPNYALAKTIQLWRAISHHNNPMRGCVSLNVAPATATLSVIHVKKFKWVFAGMPYFQPMEIFDPDTSSSAMAGLLIKDVLTKSKKELTNPLILKSQQAFHGGSWRCAYSQNTIGIASVIVHFLGGPELFNLAFFFFLFTPLLLYILRKL